MRRSSLLFIAVTVSLSSLGSFIQTSDSRGDFDSIGPNSRPTDSLSAEVILRPEGSSDSAEASGLRVNAHQSHPLVNWIPEVKAKDENRSEITLATTPSISLPNLETRDEGADQAKASVTGPNHPSVLAEESPSTEQLETDDVWIGT